MLFLDDSTGHWVDGPPLHHPRGAGGAAVVGDKIVVVGGRTGHPEQLVSQTEIFDGTGWHDGADIPVPGDHLAAAADSRYLYAVGGRKFTAGSNTDAVQRYDPATDRWTILTSHAATGQRGRRRDHQRPADRRRRRKAHHRLLHRPGLRPDRPHRHLDHPALPHPGRHGLAVTAIGNTLYAIGGSTKPGHTASTNTVEALNVPARRAHPAAAWQPRHESSVAVQQVNAAVLDGRIWVAGGLTTSSQATASTQFYDPTINSWDPGPPLPEPVHHAMLVTYHDQLVVIGGFRSRGDDLLAVTSPRMLFLDNSTGHWVDGPPLHHPRAAGGAAVVGDKIVVVGGRTGNPEQLVSQTEVFDGTGWHDGADIPVPGDHLAAAADSSYLYAVGGRKFTASTTPTRCSATTRRQPLDLLTSHAATGQRRRRRDHRWPADRRRRRKAHQRLRHRPGLRPDRPHRHLDHPAFPRPGPPRPRRHRHRQHPLRHRRLHQTRTHRIHQHRRSAHLLVTARRRPWRPSWTTSTGSSPSTSRPFPTPTPGPARRARSL